MFKDINKSQLKPTITQMASSTDYKTKLLFDKYKTIKKDLLKVLEEKKSNTVNSELGNAMHSFVKHIISTLEFPTYLSLDVNEQINKIILEYPEIDLVSILSKMFIKLASVPDDFSSEYFNGTELLNIAGRKKDAPYMSTFSGLPKFKGEVFAELVNQSKGKDTLSLRYKKLLKNKTIAFIGNWNFNLDEMPYLKNHFFDNGLSIWDNDINSISQDIYHAISAIKDKNYDPIFSSQKIDEIFKRFTTDLLNRMAIIIRRVISQNKITSFTWDQIFDEKNKLKDGIAFENLFPLLKDTLISRNLSLNDLSWDNFSLLNGSGNPTTTVDEKANLTGNIFININNEKIQLYQFLDTEISIITPGLKKIYDYLNGVSKIATAREIRPQKLMDILGIDNIDDLKNIFNSSNEVKFTANLETIKKIFDVDLISQADLDIIFPGNSSEKLDMNDLDIKLEITISKGSNSTPWDNIGFRLTKFDIAKKVMGAPISKYNEVSLNPESILQNQSAVKSLSVIPSAKNVIDNLLPGSTLNQKITYVYDKSIEGMSPNSEEILKNWVSDKLTTWGTNGIIDKIKTHIDYNNNVDRFTFKETQAISTANGNNSFTIKFSVYDNWLKYEYVIAKFNYDIINFDKFAQTVKTDLDNNYNASTDQTFTNNQTLDLGEAIPIFTSKDGSPTPANIFKINIEGRTIDAKNIKYIEKMMDGEIKKFLKITYVYSAGDFSNDNLNSRKYSSEILVNISATKATMEDLTDANDKLAIHVDDAVKKLKEISPYNSEVNKDLYQNIIDQFNTDVKEDILNGKLLIKDFENKVSDTIDKIDERTKEQIEKLSLSKKQLEYLMAIFGNNMPKEVLEWIMANPKKTKDMLDMDLNKEDIKKILSNKWVRDKIQETGTLNMDLVQKLLSLLNKIRNNNKYAYLGVGIALGVSGLAAAGASIATAKVAKRSKQLTNSQMKIKSSKLIIGLSTSIALLLILASASLMIWVFITKGGI